MRRIVAVVSALAVVTALAVIAAGRFSDVRAEPVEASSAENQLVLEADAEVTPVAGTGLVPGGHYEYSFRVTNHGPATVERLIVRSEKVVGQNAVRGLQVVNVDDSACRTDRGLQCHFPEIGPGETRTVKVRATAENTREAGDELRVRTFMASIIPGLGDQITCGVLGRPATTTGTFTTA